MPTLKSFERWAKMSLPGHEFVYHEDGLMREEAAFEYARKLYADGLVILYQRRMPDGFGFSYIACRTSLETRKILDGVAGHLDSDRPFGKTPAEKFQEFVKNNMRPATVPEFYGYEGALAAE